MQEIGFDSKGGVRSMISMRLLVVQFILLLGRRLAYAGTGSSSQRDGRTAGRISGHGSMLTPSPPLGFPAAMM